MGQGCSGLVHGDNDGQLGLAVALPLPIIIDTAHEIGVTTVVQPGGSMRDQELIDAADEHGMAMIFTGQRLFLH